MTKTTLDAKVNPRDGFRNFFERAEQDAWVASYKWFTGDSYAQLKAKMGTRAEGFSRSHKRGTDGVWYGIDVEAHEGTSIGVDLELFISRPILEDPTWISGRLGISKSLPPIKILEEWSAREAAFKAMAPKNEKLLLSHFRRSAANTLSVYSPQGDFSVQVRVQLAGRWVISLAWRSAS